MVLTADLLAGLKQGVLVGVALVALAIPPGAGTLSSTVAPGGRYLQSSTAAPTQADSGDSRAVRKTARFDTETVSAEARFIVEWIADSSDNARLPFVILDKRMATVLVFDAEARIIGASPVLLGAAAGDDSVAGIGMRPIQDVRPEERTTPAGRFISTPGRNASGEDVVWVDYDAAVSMHRVRLVDLKERRLERLASPDAAQRRISYGCINVPVAFYDAVIRPVLGVSRAVVYVLPETKSVREVFDKSYPVSSRKTITALKGAI